MLSGVALSELARVVDAPSMLMRVLTPAVVPSSPTAVPPPCTPLMTPRITLPL